MRRRAWAAGCLLTVSGCLSGPDSVTLVPSSPFINQPFTTKKLPHVTMSPGTEETAHRVLTVGSQIVLANRAYGLRPRFMTIGQAKEELFHQGTEDLFITEGLVQRCQTDAQLAAVLCRELGRMIAEREAHADPHTRADKKDAPTDVPVGTDSGGAFGSPDGTRRMELVKLENAQRKGDGPPPNPDAVARECLRRAGFDPAELDAVASLFKAADANTTLERQFTGK